jgi:hypothetical protein
MRRALEAHLDANGRAVKKDYFVVHGHADGRCQPILAFDLRCLIGDALTPFLKHVVYI